MNIKSISLLEPHQVQGMKFLGIDESKSGIISNRSESGREFNIIRWTVYKFNLNLHFLTYKQVESIVKELILCKRNNTNLVIKSNSIIERGYIDFKKIKGDGIFCFELKDIKPSIQIGTKFYSLALDLRERVDE